MQSFLAEVPKEVLEAAQVDGASLIRTLASIVVPMTAPGLAATSLICFIFSWNEFMFAVNLTATRASTAPIFLVGFISSQGLFLAKLLRRCDAGVPAGADRRVRRPGQAGPWPVARRGEVVAAVGRACRDHSGGPDENGWSTRQRVVEPVETTPEREGLRCV